MQTGTFVQVNAATGWMSQKPSGHWLFPPQQ